MVDEVKEPRTNILNRDLPSSGLSVYLSAVPGVSTLETVLVYTVLSRSVYACLAVEMVRRRTCR